MRRTDHLISGLESLAGCDVSRRSKLFRNAEVSEGGNVRSYQPNTPRRCLGSSQHRRRLWARKHTIVRSVPSDSSRVSERTRNALVAVCTHRVPGICSKRSAARSIRRNRQNAAFSYPRLAAKSWGRLNLLAHPGTLPTAYCLLPTAHSLFAFGAS